MADHAVSRLVFTKMQVVVWNFTVCIGKVFFYFFQISLFRQGRKLQESDGGYRVVPALPPLWQSKGSHIVPAEGRENDFPAEALRFYLGCLAIRRNMV